MHVQLNIKPAAVGTKQGIYIEENLVRNNKVVGRIDSSFHEWEEDGITYDIAGSITAN